MDELFCSRRGKDILIVTTLFRGRPGSIDLLVANTLLGRERPCNSIPTGEVKSVHFTEWCFSVGSNSVQDLTQGKAKYSPQAGFGPPGDLI